MLILEGEGVPSVLVVDDDPTLREMIRTILELAGFEVLDAAHGRAALELLSGLTDLPTVIVTDLMMPVMDGHELVERLRLDARIAAVPILVLSANTDPDEGLRGTLRPDAVLRKPFLPKVLAAVVGSLVSARTPGRQPE